MVSQLPKCELLGPRRLLKPPSRSGRSIDDLLRFVDTNSQRCRIQRMPGRQIRARPSGRCAAEHDRSSEGQKQHQTETRSQAHLRSVPLLGKAKASEPPFADQGLSMT
jgi:hypothetical protein